MKRKIVVFCMIVIGFLLQTTVFQRLSIASISPNILVILTSAFGFMRGRKEGMWIGLICGLFMDIFFGTFLGFYGLVYMYIGYCNGFFRKRFFPDDIKLPIVLIAGSDLSYSLLVYVFLFFLRGKFEFLYYLIHIILPELVYTILIAVFFYTIILKMNQKLEKSETRGASRFV